MTTVDILADYHAELSDEQYKLADRIDGLVKRRPNSKWTPNEIADLFRSTAEMADQAAIDAADLVLRWMAVHRYIGSEPAGAGMVVYFARS